MIVVLSADSLRRWYVIAEKEYWRRATSYILLQAKAGDAILFYVYYGKVPFEYYTDRLGCRRITWTFWSFPQHPI
jgi:hypothetical protein